VENRDLQRVVEGFMHEQNMAFSRVEQIKMFKILREDFTQESGEITPTQKIRRKVIAERYRNLLEEMYQPSRTDFKII
jgi:long-chain acyl-CoA synthetase